MCIEIGHGTEFQLSSLYCISNALKRDFFLITAAFLDVIHVSSWHNICMGKHVQAHGCIHSSFCGWCFEQVLIVTRFREIEVQSSRSEGTKGNSPDWNSSTVHGIHCGQALKAPQPKSCNTLLFLCFTCKHNSSPQCITVRLATGLREHLLTVINPTLPLTHKDPQHSRLLTSHPTLKAALLASGTQAV